MLLKERAGPLSDRQRAGCSKKPRNPARRLSALLAEVSELSALEAGTARSTAASPGRRRPARGGVAALPQLPDRDVAVDCRRVRRDPAVKGDPVRLRRH